MRWPWSKPVPRQRPPLTHGITNYDARKPASAEHGMHCDGIAVGYATDPDGKDPTMVTVITLTMSGIPVATLLMPPTDADMVAATILRVTSGGLVQ